MGLVKGVPNFDYQNWPGCSYVMQLQVNFLVGVLIVLQCSVHVQNHSHPSLLN